MTGATALHSLEHGFRTALIEDACRGVDVEDIKATREKLIKNGGVIVQSNQVIMIIFAHSVYLG